MVADGEMLRYLLQQISYRAPSILVYLLGAGLGVAFYRRAPLPAALCLLGCGLMLLTSIVSVGFQSYLVSRQMNHEIERDLFGRLMSISGMLGSVSSAVGLALIVMAVFVRRNPWGAD